jgi:hypothetical protein
MAETSEGQERVVVYLRLGYKAKLHQCSLQRSAEMGRRVSMGFVIQELMDFCDSFADPDTLPAEALGHPA